MERGESARRRKELLDRTRSLYGDREVPAIHPRYRAAYHKIYEEDGVENTETFGVRTVLCILLFMAFVLMRKFYLALMFMIRFLFKIMEKI